jgi:hypothetical protein
MAPSQEPHRSESEAAISDGTALKAQQIEPPHAEWTVEDACRLHEKRIDNRADPSDDSEMTPMLDAEH